jgi:TPR repeat protein
MTWLRSFVVALTVSLGLLGKPVSAADDLARALELLQRQNYEAAVPLLRNLAEAGDADAQAYYGGLYLVGIGGLPHDPRAARMWLERAAARSNATAATNLGLMAETGDGMAVDPAAAVRWYKQGAAGGIPFAMLKVGKAFRDGWGVPTDFTEAAKWLRAAAELGDPDARNLLGVMIAQDETNGTPIEAYAWFELAARDGQPDAPKNKLLLAERLTAADIDEALRRAAAGRASDE